jgi:uncharacterized protein (TIGR02246 family)
MTQSPAMTATRDLYHRFVDGWNGHDARSIATAMDPHGLVIGFDGGVMRGPGEVERAFMSVFMDHNPHQIVAIERSMHMLAPTVCRYLGDVGFVVPDSGELDESLNSRQTLIAALGNEGWRINQLQTTPAAMYAAPGTQLALSEELRAVLGHRSRPIP